MGGLGRHGRLGRQLEFEPIFFIAFEIGIFYFVKNESCFCCHGRCTVASAVAILPFFFLFLFWCLGVIEIELCTVVGDRVECMMASMNGIYGELGGKFGNLIIVEIVNLY